MRPSRKPQQPQTRLTTRGRIRRPTRPPVTTTTSTLTTPSDHRINEVPDAFTTEVIPTTHGIQFAVQPEYDTSQQYQPKRQQYQSIQRTREPLQQQHHHQIDQHYQTVQRQQETVQPYVPAQHYQSIPPSSQLPGQQYRPHEQQDQQHYLSVERSKVTDQISLPSDTKPIFGFNDPESGEESQWSGRTQPFISSNDIPNVTKSIATLLEVTTKGTEMTEEAESATETVASTTEAANLLLTALPNISITTEKTTVSVAVFVFFLRRTRPVHLFYVPLHSLVLLFYLLIPFQLSFSRLFFSFSTTMEILVIATSAMSVPMAKPN